MKKYLFASISLMFLRFETVGNAIVYNFIKEGVAQELGYVSWSSGTEAAHGMFFDNFSSGNPGGLGVCITIDPTGGLTGVSGLCDGNSDDNQLTDEYFCMMFDNPTNIDSIVITGNHDLPAETT